MRRFGSILLVLALVGGSLGFALEQGDRDSICKIVDHFSNAWNQNHGKGSSDHYAQDADFVNIFGMVFSGKNEIEERHIQVHKGFLKDTIFTTTDLKIREVQPDLVMVQAYWNVDGVKKPESQEKGSMRGVFTHVFIKRNGQWEITSTQNTRTN